MKHIVGPVCPSCEQKLLTAHPTLQAWFHKAKRSRPDLHISWAYRDKATQEQAFLEKKSKLHYPHSAHNKVPALALDLFQLDSGGKGVFDGVYMAKLNAEMGAGLQWGGQWKGLGDSDHFELVV